MHFFKFVPIIIATCFIGAQSVGCADKPTPPTPSSQTAAAESGHTHGGWWCDVHGVPEAICTRCDASLVADFKAKNDWCREHERPDSQCFLCHPELEAKFAAQYEAKYGKQPPKPSEDGHDHGHDHEGHDHEHADEATS